MDEPIKTPFDVLWMRLGIVKARVAHHGGKDEGSECRCFFLSPEAILFLLAFKEGVSFSDGPLHFETKG